MAAVSHTSRRIIYMLALIVAGEAIFALPFHITRFFRPTVLDVFSITATELGAAQGLYGITAMAAYVLGGPLADHYEARKLLAWSLWLTAAGGLYMAGFPGYRGVMALWAFFGITTILLFWAALIRATREWGGEHQQGRAYGLLDGGRGLLAAALASLAVGAFAVALPEGYAAADMEQRRTALRAVIYGYSAVTALVGLLVWFAIREVRPPGETSRHRWRPQQEALGTHFARVLRFPAVWLQSLVVLCAYVGYKGFDNYSLFAVQAYGLDPVEAARVVTIASWMRPVAALGAGLLGDRFGTARMTFLAFLMLLVSDLVFATITPAGGALWLLLGNTLVGAAAFFGLRGLYFALFKEMGLPAALTGTAVGIVSVIGFTPDIFVTFVAGLLMDHSPGLAGHQHVFWLLAAFAALGCAASLGLMRLGRATDAGSATDRR